MQFAHAVPIVKLVSYCARAEICMFIDRIRDIRRNNYFHSIFPVMIPKLISTIMWAQLPVRMYYMCHSAGVRAFRSGYSLVSFPDDLAE